MTVGIFNSLTNKLKIVQKNLSQGYHKVRQLYSNNQKSRNIFTKLNKVALCDLQGYTSLR